MRNLEKKMDAMARCCLAETLADWKAAMDELRELMGGNSEPIPVPPRSVENAVYNILLELGTPSHIKGYACLVTALCAVVEDAEHISVITKRLYPLVAQKHNTTASRVKRSIRHAIEVTWERADPDVLMRYFGNTVSADRGKPTNSEFISRVAQIVRRQMNA